MCSQAKCKHCGRPSWMGCGQHVENALRNVPVQDRCPNYKKHNAYGPCNAPPMPGWDASAAQNIGGFFGLFMPGR